MNILITGGTGFIGAALCPYLLRYGHQITVLTRDIQSAEQKLPKGIHLVDALDFELMNQTDVVINLAGASIAKRWTHAYQAQILASRLNITQHLISLMTAVPHKPKIFISGSAIGYYGPQGDVDLSEHAPSVMSFSHQLCANWELVAQQAQAIGIRTCILRTGIVLGPNGGALAQMRTPFMWGFGGPIGSGKQWMSWCHIEDWIRIVQFCLNDNVIEGPINATAPFAVTNSEFSKTLGQVLHRPSFMRMPAFMIRMLMGQMGEELILSGQKVIPKKLMDMGFTFKYPRLKEALMQIEHQQEAS